MIEAEGELNLDLLLIYVRMPCSPPSPNMVGLMKLVFLIVEAINQLFNSVFRHDSIGATKKGARGPWVPPIRSKIGKIRSKMGQKVAKLGLLGCSM